jgi:uncharacterized protein (TIGR03000 family)
LGVGLFLGAGYPYYGSGYYGGGYGGYYGAGYSTYAPSYYEYAPSYYDSTYVAPSTPIILAPPAAPGYAAGGAGGQAVVPDLKAHVAVKAPADAEIWFGEGKTRQTGEVREFVSPALKPGQAYTYVIKAKWTEGGKEVVQTREIDVTAGSRKAIDFTKPAPEEVEAPKPVKP